MKRFTETTKWSDPWYRRLSPAAKLLWLYLTDNCDCSGLIDLDLDAATFHIGTKIEERHIAELVDRVQRTVEGKIYISRFIPFQYGSLSEGCPAHKPVIKLVMERNLTMNGKGYQYPNATLSVEYLYSTGKGKGKGKGESAERGSALEVYEAYPLKVGKPAALKAITTALTKTPFDDLLAKTRAFAAARGGDMAFVPHPATWFNQERYNDNPETWRPSAPGGKAAPVKSAKEERLDREFREAQEKYGQGR